MKERKQAKHFFDKNSWDKTFYFLWLKILVSTISLKGDHVWSDLEIGLFTPVHEVRQKCRPSVYSYVCS